MSQARWNVANLPSSDGRTVVITGANSGLGFAAARQLARVGAKVVLAVRDVVAGEDAADRIGGDTDVRHLDLADLGSVKQFAADWRGDIDVLVNNAGLMMVPKRHTRDGFESQIGVNHFGHFALTNLLLPHITDRVITVSSQAHRRGAVVLDDLNWERRSYSPAGAYAQSKLANLLFVLNLQNRLTSVGHVLSLAAHPGWAATNLQSHTGNRLQHAAMQLGNRIVAQDADAGALPILYAASQPLPPASYVGPDGFGEYRGEPTLVGRTADASNPVLAEQLWDISEQVTGVRFARAK
ncbi:oxidoreductase [Mycobacterium sp. 134]|uniref:oxidoreductase n=1 Tax=Mycobacterium sp. 134 TaxID=3400425 RepID=UPI003AAED0A8